MESKDGPEEKNTDALSKVGKLDDLRMNLYSRNFTEEELQHQSLSKESLDVEHDWDVVPSKEVPTSTSLPTSPTPPTLTSASLQTPPQSSSQSASQQIPSTSQEPKKSLYYRLFGKRPFHTKIFIISVIFFVLCVGFVAFVFITGFNIVSAGNVDITFTGPASSPAGDELDFDVAIQNKNSAPLVGAELNLDFPAGTQDPSNSGQEFRHVTYSLGNVDAGAIIHRPVRIMLYGNQHTVQTINGALTYTLKGSDDPFRKEEVYSVTISQAPVSLSVDAPTETLKSQDITLTVHVVSNSATDISNLALAVHYPFGFQVSSTTPAALDNSVWQIPVIHPGENQSFTIIGQINGNDNDDKVFHFNLGSTGQTYEDVAKASYQNLVQTISIKKPPMGLSFSFLGDNNSTQYSVKPGKLVEATVVVTNNLPNQILDAHVELKISGSALQPGSISVGTDPTVAAFYRSSDNTYVWDKSNIPQLIAMTPGQSFSFPIYFSIVNQSNTLNPTVEMSATASAKHSAEDVSILPLFSSVTRSIRVQSQPNFNSILEYSKGPLSNSGPIPPRANTPTTYTVVWTVTNPLNDMSNAQITANLPQYVDWLKVVSPQSETENVTWNPLTNQVVWHIGDIPGGGVSASTKQVAFQIRFNPSTSQLDSQPELVQNQTLTATDDYTNVPVSIPSSNLTTGLYSESQYNAQSGYVTN